MMDIDGKEWLEMFLRNIEMVPGAGHATVY
jgi:hypothetical protein